MTANSVLETVGEVAFTIFCDRQSDGHRGLPTLLGWERHNYSHLSYDVASGSEITPCNKIDKPLVVYRVVYRFTGNVMTSITTLRT